MIDKEKVKAYDEALKKASAAYKDEDKHLKATLERIFPELNENKDEMVKTAIINHLKKMWGNCQDNICGVHVEDAIDWIEKQGKQTSPQTNERTWLYLVSEVLTWKDGIGQYLDDPRVQELAKKLCNDYTQKLYNPSVISNNKIEPKFKVSDWVVFDTSKSVYQVEKIENYEYTLRHVLGGSLCLPFSNEELIREWTLQDAKDGDVLVYDDDILLFKSYSAQGLISLYCWYNGHPNNFHSKEVIDILLTTTNKICPATKKQHDALMKAMNDAGYEWDTEKKELKKKRKR